MVKLSEVQYVTMVVAGMVSAMLSILGSLIVVYTSRKRAFGIGRGGSGREREGRRRRKEEDEDLGPKRTARIRSFFTSSFFRQFGGGAASCANSGNNDNTNTNDESNNNNNDSKSSISLADSIISTSGGDTGRRRGSSGRRGGGGGGGFSSRGTTNTYHRLVMLISISDIITSLMLYFHVLLVPSSEVEKTNLLWAKYGTQQTCTVVGSFSAWSFLCTSFLHGVLSIYFLCIVKYGWKQFEITRYIEIPSMIIIGIVPIAVAIVGVVYQTYNVNSLAHICMICFKDETEYLRETNCYYGDKFGHLPEDWIQCLHSKVKDEGGNETQFWMTLYLSNVYMGLCTLAPLIGFCCTYAVYRHVTVQYSRTTRRSLSFNAALRNSKEVAWQSIWYSVAYGNTFVWPFVMVIIATVGKIHGSQGNPALYLVQLFSWMFLPLQGAINAVVYLRPRYREWKLAEPTLPFWGITRCILEDIPLRRRHSSAAYAAVASSFIITKKQPNSGSSTDAGGVYGESGLMSFMGRSSGGDASGSIQFNFIIDDDEDDIVMPPLSSSESNVPDRTDIELDGTDRITTAMTSPVNSQGGEVLTDKVTIPKILLE